MKTLLGLLVPLVFLAVIPSEGTSKSAAAKSQGHNPAIASWLLGGREGDAVHDVVVDRDGNVIVTGTTASPNFPVVNAAQMEPGDSCEVPPCTDAFVAKFSPEGRIIFSTYLGGGLGNNTSGFDVGWGVAVDAEGSSYVTGTTHSVDFPTTTGAFKPMLGPGEEGDAFVTKMNPSGEIVYSTFLGGMLSSSGSDGADEGKDVVVDGDGNAYILGWSSNIDFPTRAGPQLVNAGEEDLFVAKLDPSGGQLTYATYLGGSSHDYAGALSLSQGGSIFVTGTTMSQDFPTTEGAAQTSFGGGTFDAIVTRLSPPSPSLDYSTFLGGSSSDLGYTIDTTSDGDAYIGGATTSVDFPVRGDPFQRASSGKQDGFISRVDPTGSEIKYSTYLGGPRNDYVSSLSLNEEGVAVAGATMSRSFPIRSAMQGEKSRKLDGFVTIFHGDRSLAMSTFLGGGDRFDKTFDTPVGPIAAGNDLVSAIALTPRGTFVVGSTSSRSFPTINSSRPRPARADGFVTLVSNRQSDCTLLGSERVDHLSGTPQKDIICGRGGRDLLEGRLGDDLLQGGSGVDACRGGPGLNQESSCER